MKGIHTYIEDYLGDKFEKFGRFVAKRPRKVIWIAIVCSLLLWIGFVNFRIELRMHKVFCPQDSWSADNEQAILDNFGYEPRVIQVLLTAGGANVLTKNTLLEMAEIDTWMRNIRVNVNSQTYGLNEICIKVSRAEVERHWPTSGYDSRPDPC